MSSAAAGRRVVNIKVTVVNIVRIESQPKQSLFAVENDAGRNIEKGFGFFYAGGITNVYKAILLNDKQTAVPGVFNIHSCCIAGRKLDKRNLRKEKVKT